MSSFSTIVHKLTLSHEDSLYDKPLPDITFEDKIKYIGSLMKQCEGTTDTYTNSELPSVNRLIFEVNRFVGIPDTSFKSFLNPSGFRNKFQVLKDVLQSFSMKTESKDKFCNVFNKSQRHYFAFCKLAYIYKLRKYTHAVDTDLYLNKLSPSQKNVISVIQNNKIYLFTLQDLTKIIVNSLTICDDMFIAPKSPKNPYNNMDFSKADIFNLFWKHITSLLRVPTIIDKFVYNNMDLSSFVAQCHGHIIDNEIHQIVTSSNISVQAEHIREMIAEWYHREDMFLNFNMNFPKERLVEIFLPYLELYLKFRYSLDRGIQSKSFKLLSNALQKFDTRQFNAFGRKIISMKKNNTNGKLFKTKPTYNDKHPEPPHNVSNLRLSSTIVYLNSHLSLQDKFTTDVFDWRINDDSDTDDTDDADADDADAHDVDADDADADDVDADDVDADEADDVDADDVDADDADDADDITIGTLTSDDLLLNHQEETNDDITMAPLTLADLEFDDEGIKDFVYSFIDRNPSNENPYSGETPDVDEYNFVTESECSIIEREPFNEASIPDISTLSINEESENITLSREYINRLIPSEKKYINRRIPGEIEYMNRLDRLIPGEMEYIINRLDRLVPSEITTPSNIDTDTNALENATDI